MMDPDTQVANRRAAWRWGSMIVGLLGLQVAGGVMAIMLATGDESVAVVPDYHQKGLDWDKEVALRNASLSLGWNCQIAQLDAKASSTPSDEVSGKQSAAGLSLRLTDHSGQPIELRSGELQLYRHARAADVRRVRIPPGSFSQLELNDCFDAAGLWQVTIDVTDRDGNRFASSKELDIQSEGLGRSSKATGSSKVD